MPCWTLNNTWSKTLSTKDGGSKQFSVQLNRETSGFCGENFKIFVNGKQIEHELTPNRCSPLCGTGGVYQWEQDSHNFMIMYNNVSLLRMARGYRLFIDGIDVDTGMEFKAFFRSRGMQFFFLGLLGFIIGVVLIVLHYTQVTTKHSFMWAGYGMTAVGCVYMVIGLIPILRKYQEPRYSHGSCANAQGTKSHCNAFC